MVISVASQKGGTGKTTTLAAGLGKKSKIGLGMNEDIEGAGIGRGLRMVKKRTHSE